jgi:hypothetical protein
VLAKRDGPFTFGRPDAPDKRLQTDAVLVDGPYLDGRLGMLEPLRLDGAVKLF